jgi:hypothetical protein
MLRSLALAVLLAATRPAAACHDCSTYLARPIGVGDGGLFVVTWTRDTGESDWVERWGLTVTRGAALVCDVAIGIGEAEDSVSATGPRAKLCERLVHGLHRNGAAVIARAAEQLHLTPLEPTPTPPVTIRRSGKGDGDGLRYQVRVSGHGAAKVSLDEADDAGWFAGSWAVNAYRHPAFDGLFVRVMTLLTGEEDTGKARDCHDVLDETLALPRSAAR